ncbi:LysM peptidoglycan-binding domain-containing protein [Actinophytocola sp.]|uniref:LysM peptidoglycan-binding domain-containing protein n=1 Tax=Actinophytocola sp. TaxID=1872138 RepID=UPI00389A7904
MSATTHKPEVEALVPVPRTRPVVRRVAPGRPPTRRARVAGAPRVLARRSCAPQGPRLSLVWVLAVASVACAAVLGLGALASSTAPVVPSTTKVVRVLPGESLWELAGRVAPSADPSAVVERIEELNGIDGGVEPGQPLTVPFSR